jgi:hypothetical protein
MGRSFASIRQQAKEIADRWVRSSRPGRPKQAAARLAVLGTTHSSEAFFGCDDPLEAVLFSAFLELRKLPEGGTDVDP